MTSGLAQQWRACGAYYHVEGDAIETHPWRDTLAAAEEDKRLIGNDRPAPDELYLLTRWVTEPVRIDVMEASQRLMADIETALATAREGGGT